MGKHKKRRRHESTSSSSTDEDKRERHRRHSKKSKRKHSKKRTRHESSERSSDDTARRSKEPEPRVVVRPPPDDSTLRGRTHGDAPDKSDGEISPSANEDDALNEILGLMPSKSIEPADIDSQISARWGNIVTIGLTPELRGELLRNYPTPANCPMLSVPKLNAEIDVSLSEGLRKKEEGYTALQGQLVAGLSALGVGLSKALTLRGQNASLVDPWLKNISDAGRILADLHHEVSVTRQKIVMPVIANPNIRKLAESSGIDKLLFGGDLSDKIKAAKEVEKSSHDLKGKEAAGKSKKSTAASKSDPRNRTAFAKSSLNFKRPSRQFLPKKTTESGGHHYRAGNHRQRK